MTTAEIEALANQDGLAIGDFATKLLQVHRRMVIPEFLRDIDRVIGHVHWRRKATTFAVTAPTRNYDCPSDFAKFELITPADSTSPTGLKATGLDYIGEDEWEVLKAEAATRPGPPTAYYVVAGSPAQFAIRLACPPDGSYTLHALYWRMIPWTNDTATVTLDDYIPWQYQGGLVKRLRMYILEDRIGIRDNRYSVAASEYKAWIESLEYAKEAAPRTKVVTCR